MELALVFIGLPVVGYLGLASLPRGWPALIGIVAAALVIAVLWATFGIGSDDSYLTALIGFLFSAAALAAIVQVIRQMIGEGRPRWVYPSVVGTALLATGIPLLNILGV
jgi:hypothetical protein